MTMKKTNANANKTKILGRWTSMDTVHYIIVITTNYKY